MHIVTAMCVIHTRSLLLSVRMQVVVLYRGDWQPGPHASFDEKCFHARAAFQYALQKFKLLTGGSHAVPESAMLKLLSAMNMTREAKTWEIGCGRPGLAAAISAATGQCVLCTDIGDVYAGLKDIAHNEMGLRDLSANRVCFLTANKLTWDELLEISRNKTGEYLPKGAKLLGALKSMYPADPALLSVQSLGKVVEEKATVSRPSRRKSGRNSADCSGDDGATASPTGIIMPRRRSATVATDDYCEEEGETRTPAQSKKGRSGRIFDDEDDSVSAGWSGARTASAAPAKILHVVEGMRGSEGVGHDEGRDAELYDLFDLGSGYEGPGTNPAGGAMSELDSEASQRLDVMSELGFRDWG
jgi:hypothetical protein